MSTYTITPVQAQSATYRKAIRKEISIWKDTTDENLSENRMNRPEILRYKAFMLGGKNEYTDYADWAEILLKDYGPQTKCFSLGSGIGRVERYLINRGFTERFDTIELNPNLNSKLNNMSDNISAIDGDLNFINLKENSYDFILCHGVLHHLINVEYVLNQLNKALKKEGIIVFYEYIGEDRWQFSPNKLDTLQKNFPQWSFKNPPVWSVEGFESIRSSELLTLIGKRFEGSCERLVTYGSLYFPFVLCTPDEADADLEQVISLDHQQATEHQLKSCFMLGIYRKNSLADLTSVSWSDQELYDRLFPQQPLHRKLYNDLRESPAAPFLKATKNYVVSWLK